MSTNTRNIETLIGTVIRMEGNNANADYKVVIDLGEFYAKASDHHLWAIAYVGIVNLIARRQSKWLPLVKDSKVTIDLPILLDLLDAETNVEDKKYLAIANSMIKAINEGELGWEDIDEQVVVIQDYIRRKAKDPKITLALPSRDARGIMSYLKTRDSLYETKGIKPFMA